MAGLDMINPEGLKYIEKNMLSKKVKIDLIGRFDNEDIMDIVLYRKKILRSLNMNLWLIEKGLADKKLLDKNCYKLTSEKKVEHFNRILESTQKNPK